jgi:lysophospholipid acyltransferase (LPLAT)-like uncharacterized protein
MFKAIRRWPPVTWILSHYIWLLMTLVRVTTRWTFVGRDLAQPVWDSGRGAVWCFWHSRILGVGSIWPRTAQKVFMLISPSQDGQLVSRAVELLGMTVIRGSSTRKKGEEQSTTDSQAKGSLQALRRMVNHAARGGCVGITPDGPRGPRMRAQAGAVRVARAAGVPIVPTAYAVKGAKILTTWDGGQWPPLFAEGWVVYGNPIIVPPKADEDTLERIRLELERALIAVSHHADSLAGVPIIEPAPVSA